MKKRIVLTLTAILILELSVYGIIQARISYNNSKIDVMPNYAIDSEIRYKGNLYKMVNEEKERLKKSEWKLGSKIERLASSVENMTYNGQTNNPELIGERIWVSKKNENMIAVWHENVQAYFIFVRKDVLAGWIYYKNALYVDSGSYLSPAFNDINFYNGSNFAHIDDKTDLCVGTLQGCNRYTFPSNELETNVLANQGKRLFAELEADSVIYVEEEARNGKMYISYLKYSDN